MKAYRSGGFQTGVMFLLLLFFTGAFFGDAFSADAFFADATDDEADEDLVLGAGGFDFDMTTITPSFLAHAP